MKASFLLLAVAILGSAFFSGSETAVISSNRLRQRAARREGRPLAGSAERLYRSPGKMLAVLLLGTNAFNVLASVGAMLLTERYLDGRGWHLPALASDLVSTLWIAALLLVFGEVLPKGLGRVYADRITRSVSPLLLPLAWMLWPLLALLEALARLFAGLLPTGSAGDAGPPSWETVRLHLETGLEAGAVAPEEEILIGRIARLNRLGAGSLMRPLSQLFLFPFEAKVGDLLADLPESPGSPVFLFRKGSSKLDGFISPIKLLGQDPERPLSELAGSLRRVPASRPLLDLIDELQFTHGKFALVTDLEDRALGVVFLRDLLGKLLRLRQSSDIAEK